MPFPRRAALAVACAAAVVGPLATALPASAAETTTWSQAIVPGRYEVTLRHPLSNADPGTYRVQAEGRTALSIADLYWDKTFEVEVTDGRLDLQLDGPSRLDGLRVYPTRLGDPTSTPAPTNPTPTPPTPTPTAPTGATAAQRLFPGARSDRPLSGVRPGGTQSLSNLRAWGTWRGRPADTVLTFGNQGGYDALASSSWPVQEWNGFDGELIYSLPLIPWQRDASLADVAAGRHDETWAAVARQLRDNGRGDAVVRVGWEYNIGDMPWWTTTDNVGTWKQAFRRVVTQMRAVAPGLRFEFGLNCGSGLLGSSDRLAPLTMGYPGDDVVDLVGCDSYDWWQTKGSTPEEFARSLHPAYTPGMGDVVDFARAHGKLASFAEWGLAVRSDHGGGDDAYYVQAMNDFFVANKDVVAVESYFEESEGMGNALSMGQAPNAGAAYRRLFGAS